MTNLKDVLLNTFPTKNLFTVNRWFSLIVGLMMSVASGTQYMFGVLGPRIKQTMEYEQYQINLIGTLTNLGAYAGVVPALVNDVFGARPASLFSGFLVWFGWFFAYLCVNKSIPSNYIIVGLFFALMGNGSSGAYSCAMSTNMKNYSLSNRGVIVGLNSASFGISATVFTAIFKYIFMKKLTPFMLFMSLLCGGIPFILGTIFENIVPEKPKDEMPELTESSALLKEENSTPSIETEPVQETETTLALPTEVVKDGDQDLNALQMILTIDFWLFVAVYFAGAGAGLTLVNNLGSLVLSYGGQDGDQDIMVVLYGIGNCCGRLVFGFLSDKLSAYAQRTTFFNTGVLLMGICCYVISFTPLYLLTPVITVTGFCYGGLLVSSPSFVSERFGAKYFAVNSAITALSPVAASYLISTVFAAKIYQSHIRGNGKNCYGKQCYGITLLSISGLCTCAFILGLVLMHRNRKYYAQREKLKQIK